jgi:glycosyltransferase involved in cell wall biosynthesis|tara:strand:- start:1332 stop:2519 length:1188 start_codon:yes stop_codon:yes gene_type:complete
MTKNFERSIRVANIIEEGRLGGPQMRMALVASILGKSEFNNKVDITFIFPKKDSMEFRERCDSIGIKYYLFSFTKISRNWINILRYLILFPVEVLLLANFLKKHSFDIVHVSGGSRQSKGIIAAKLAKIKVVWEMNDTYAPIIVRNVYFLLSRLADCFVFASYRTKSYYEKLTPKNKKIFLIQSPVNVNFYDPYFELPVEEFIKQNIEEKKIIIGTVANVSPVKDLKLFLKIVKKLSSYSNKVVFIVVGSIHNSQKDYYEHLLEDISRQGITNFFFLGSRTDVRSLLKAMDIYVCSSKYESSPLSLLEAMAMKKAIVSTDVGDVKNFINHGVDGFIVENNDEDALANYLKKLIDDPKLRHNLGESARKVVKDKFDLKICVRSHLDMYQKIVNDYK